MPEPETVSYIQNKQIQHPQCAKQEDTESKEKREYACVGNGFNFKLRVCIKLFRLCLELFVYLIVIVIYMYMNIYIYRHPFGQ